jgi:hypothetical protein
MKIRIAPSQVRAASPTPEAIDAMRSAFSQLSAGHAKCRCGAGWAQTKASHSLRVGLTCLVKPTKHRSRNRCRT